MADDSPLSIAGNIIGILTFVVALIAGVYARMIWLKSKIQSDMDIVEACYSLLRYLAQTALLDKASKPGDCNFDKSLEELYSVEVQLAMEFTRLAKLSTVRRIREWNKEQPRIAQGLRDIDNLLHHIRWLQMNADLTYLSM